MVCGVWVYVASVGCSRVWFVGSPGLLIYISVALHVLNVSYLGGMCVGGVYVRCEVAKMSDGFVAQVRT